jgi:hypothetical protein
LSELFSTRWLHHRSGTARDSDLHAADQMTCIGRSRSVG